MYDKTPANDLSFPDSLMSMMNNPSASQFEDEIYLLPDTAEVYKAYDMSSFKSEKPLAPVSSSPFELISEEMLWLNHHEYQDLNVSDNSAISIEIDPPIWTDFLDVSKDVIFENDSNQNHPLAEVTNNNNMEFIMNPEYKAPSFSSSITNINRDSEAGETKIISPYNSMNTIIKAIGIGGGGCNALNFLHESGVDYLETIAVNTDGQTLERTQATKHIKLGPNGLGAGGDPELGRRYAEEQKEQISEFLKDSNMVFLSTSMGGGTGTGSSPVVAKLANDLDILVFSVVYMPYEFEGKTERANHGLDELQKYSDALIVIPNDNLEHIDADDFHTQMSSAHQVLVNSISGVYEVLANHGMFNADFNDLKAVCKHRGRAIIGIGESGGRGEERVEQAVMDALNNPLIDIQKFDVAKSMLINLRGRFGKKEIAKVNSILSNYVQGGLVKICLMPDENLGDKLQITVIATGISHDQSIVQSVEERIGSANSENMNESTNNSIVLDRVEKERKEKRKENWVNSNSIFDSSLKRAQQD